MVPSVRKNEGGEDSYGAILKEIVGIRKDINFAVVPKFIDFSAKVKDLVELAVEVWRLENRINKTFSEDQRETIIKSVQKIKRYLDKNDIEIVDHTNQKFNEGLNLDVLAVEKDHNISESKIKETIEPTITYKGKVVHKGKIIVSEKEEVSGVENE